MTCVIAKENDLVDDGFEAGGPFVYIGAHFVIVAGDFLAQLVQKVHSFRHSCCFDLCVCVLMPSYA